MSCSLYCVHSAALLKYFLILALLRKSKQKENVRCQLRGRDDGNVLWYTPFLSRMFFSQASAPRQIRRNPRHANQMRGPVLHQNLADYSVRANPVGLCAHRLASLNLPLAIHNKEDVEGLQAFGGQQQPLLLPLVFFASRTGPYHKYLGTRKSTRQWSPLRDASSRSTSPPHRNRLRSGTISNVKRSDGLLSKARLALHQNPSKNRGSKSLGPCPL